MSDLTLSELVVRLQRSRAVNQLWRDVLRFLSQRGISQFGYHLHQPLQDGPDRVVFAHGFPEDWVATYVEEGLADHDPITTLAARRGDPFFWSEVDSLTPLTPGQAAFLEVLRAADLGDGIAMQVHGPNMRSAYVGLGIGRGRERPCVAAVAELRAAAQFAHIRLCELTADTISLERDLSPREREVLGWIARGKSNAIIAEIVGVSPHTVDTVVRRIFDKLEATDRTTAALRGLGAGVVMLDGAHPA